MAAVGRDSPVGDDRPGEVDRRLRLRREGGGGLRFLSFLTSVTHGPCWGLHAERERHAPPFLALVTVFSSSLGGPGQRSGRAHARRLRRLMHNPCALRPVRCITLMQSLCTMCMFLCIQIENPYENHKDSMGRRRRVRATLREGPCQAVERRRWKDGDGSRERL